MTPFTTDEFKDLRTRTIRVTQRELARLLGVTKTSVMMWETGRRPIDQRTMLAMKWLAGARQAVDKRRQEWRDMPLRTNERIRKPRYRSEKYD